MIKKVLPFILCIMFVSCTNNYFDDLLFRNYSDPFQDKPVIDAFTKINSIHISWKKDTGADKYILLRAEDDKKNLSFIPVYEGTETSFEDSSVISEKLYIYRLDKMRGNSYFEGELYTGGAALKVTKDKYEYNDDISSATYLDNSLDCNLLSLRFQYSGFDESTKNYNDEDWFYIIVPGKRYATMTITQNPTTPYLLSWQAGEDKIPVPLNNSSSFQVFNNYPETRKIYFKIFPTQLDNSFVDSFSQVITYTIELSVIHQVAN